MIQIQCRRCMWSRKRNGKKREGLHTAGAIEKPITSLDCIIHNVRGFLVLYLPQAEANLGHLVAIVQLDTWNVDHDCCASLEESLSLTVYFLFRGKRSTGLGMMFGGRRAKINGKDDADQRTRKVKKQMQPAAGIKRGQRNINKSSTAAAGIVTEI